MLPKISLSCERVEEFRRYWKAAQAEWDGGWNELPYESELVARYFYFLGQHNLKKEIVSRALKGDA